MSDINEIPESFNRTLLEKALLQYTDDPTLELINYKIQDNSAVISNHFSSILFKVELEYVRESQRDTVYRISAFVKTLPDVPEQSHNIFLKSVQQTAQFDTELDVYNNVLPKMEIMLYGIGISNLAPRQMYQTKEPVPILVMEDMISLGYTTIHDRSQISFESSKVLIGKLAQFHATSFVLDKQMNAVSHLNAVYFDHHMNISYVEDMNRRIEMMKKLDGFEQIVEQLEGTTEKMFEDVRNIYYNQDEAECKVLCHGDMKFENTLIKMEEEVVSDGVFVDFAYTNFHTPAIDLFEFLYKVPALHVIVQKESRDELIQHYLEVFSNVIDKTGTEGGHEIIEKIKNEMDRCNVLQVWFVMFLVVYKLKLFNEEGETDTENINYEEKWLKYVLWELLHKNE